LPNWSDILNEINAVRQNGIGAAQAAQDLIRRKYLKQLYEFDVQHRNIIAYYSGFLSKPGIQGIDINDEDKNGFMMAIHGLDPKYGLDLILHTPGGSMAATESLVDYLKQKFGNDIRAIVPQIAMSGGTMIACSCRQILMGRQSNLGPVDPQLGGIPAAGVIQEFKKAYQEIKKDPDRVQVWQFVLRQYTPSFLSRCENAFDRARNFVQQGLETNMFSGLSPKGRTAQAKKVVRALTDFSGNKGHDRHIHYSELKAMGLNVELLENNQNYQDLVLTVHHCYMHSLMNTNAFKIIENHKGAAFVKQQQTFQLAGVPGQAVQMS
jgi:hypothetical protein